MTKAFCLITSVPGRDPGPAVASAEADGWSVIVNEDTHKKGPGWNRNVLFHLALQEGAEVVRYLDDDDLLFPHREQALEALNGFDMVTTGYRLKIQDSHQDYMHNTGGFFVDSWGWIATTEALCRLKNQYGRLWCDWPVYEGLKFFKDAEKLLRVGKLPLIAYQYNQNPFGSTGHNHPLKNLYMNMLRSMV